MTEPRVVEPAPTTTAGSRSPLRKTVRDMLLSMGVVGGIIFAGLAISWRPQPDPVREVQAEPVAQQVAAVADFPVLYPQVAEGWRATSARFEPTEESGDEAAWFNGWVTPDDEFVAVVQSRATNDDFIEEQTAGGFLLTDRTELPAAAQGWDAYVSANGEQRSLVRIEDDVTTVVTGTGEWAEVLAFTQSLAPVPVAPAAGG